MFQISSNGALTSLYSFSGASDGSQPVAGLVLGSDGNFYSTTEYGGTNGDGTVFRISTNGDLTSLYSFTGSSDGYAPGGGLARGSDSTFYGTTEYGGTNDAGTVFQISPGGALTSLYSFTGGNDGGEPEAGLAPGTDGNLYGTTGYGGTNYCGTLFKISPNGVLATLYSFTGVQDGAIPQAGLMQARDGNFYGTTESGGMGAVGTVFQLDVGLSVVLPAPAFQSVTITDGTLTLTWNTEIGWKYQMQYSSDLSSGTWTSLGGPIAATAVTLSTTDSITNGLARFYRLLVLPKSSGT